MQPIIMKARTAAMIAALVPLSSAVLAQEPEADSHGEDAELATPMSQLQTFAHKLALSIEAQNGDLAGFYLHELEETSESIIDEIPEYEGLVIGPLVSSLLMPQIERLEAAIGPGDWEAAADVFGDVVNACNACHQATEHGFIVIDYRPGVNPFMQSFAPR